MKTIRKAGITCCSNGQPPAVKEELEQLGRVLREGGIEPVFGEHLFAGETVFPGTRQERARELMDFYRDPSVDAVFDISGGNLANEILDELDYRVIRAAGKPFFGYSDLTSVINTLLTMAGQQSVLYQVRNLVGEDGETQRKNFFSFLKGESRALLEFPYTFLQGSRAEGVLVGGNMRCLLKLAGTPYFPETEGRLLFLEGLRGNVPAMTALLSQLRQMGVFDRAAGVILGTFTQMEEEKSRPSVEELLLGMAPQSLPILKTSSVGHAPDSKALLIGDYYCF